MNRIEKASIGGQSFHLEAGAYEILKKYLGELEAHYDRKGREGREVLEGIEERLAELLLEKSSKGGVVSERMVEEAVGTLGKPSDIEEESGIEEPAAEEKPKKKLYRDTVNKILGGVCSGLAAYLHLDVVLVRIIFVALLCLGIHIDDKTDMSVSVGVVVAYLIAWICIPAARTVKQRLEMKGEKGSVDEIQRSIESGARQVAEAARQVGRSGFWPVFGRICAILAGILLIVVGASGLFAGTFTFFGQGLLDFIERNLMNTGMEYEEFAKSISDAISALAAINGNVWTRILMGLCYFLPFIGMIYGGLMMTFEIKAPSWKPGLVIFLVWLLSIIALGTALSYFFFINVMQ